MKKVFSILLITVLLVFLLPSSSVSAEEQVVWQYSSAGIEGGEVSALAIDPQNPSTLYAGTNAGGIFKSINGGDLEP